MKTRIGKNDFDLCSSITGRELLNNNTANCENESHTRKYILNSNKKLLIKNGFNREGIDLADIKWVGENRTQLLSGTRLQYGYSKFVNED